MVQWAVGTSGPNRAAARPARRRDQASSAAGASAAAVARSGLPSTRATASGGTLACACSDARRRTGSARSVPRLTWRQAWAGASPSASRGSQAGGRIAVRLWPSGSSPWACR